MDRFQFLLQFSTPMTVKDALELVVGTFDTPQLIALLEDFEQRGLLVRVGAPSDAAPCILDYLDEEYRSDAALAAIGHHLSTGRCLVLNNAFQADFAERMYASLDETSSWLVNEDFSIESFSYHHHNIFEQHLFTHEMRLCADMLGSEPTKKIMGRLSNRDCSGEPAFGAGLYLPGDYSLPHNDENGLRSVTFIWYLTKGWDALWGGQLHWCPTWQMVQPDFNTLVLFDVSATTRHFVAQVRPTAKGRRYTINAWWQSPTEESARKPTRPLDPAANPPPAIPGLRVL
jgi:Rps23 Pro-64 3,4-dihydroxylase Tpa1-like proline 4-hydroxylase